MESRVGRQQILPTQPPTGRQINRSLGSQEQEPHSPQLQALPLHLLPTALLTRQLQHYDHPAQGHPVLREVQVQVRNHSQI